jgi:hypothetical protein
MGLSGQGRALRKARPVSSERVYFCEIIYPKWPQEFHSHNILFQPDFNLSICYYNNISNLSNSGIILAK